MENTLIVSEVNNTTPPKHNLMQGENPMAEVDMIQLSSEHSDIRREAVEHTNEIVKEGLKAEAAVLSRVDGTANEIIKEGLKGNYNTLDNIKDSRFETISRIENSADRISKDITDHAGILGKDVGDFRNSTSDRFFAVARDTQDIRAQLVATQQQLVAGFMGVSKDTEIAALKTQMDAAKNTQYLGDKIEREGDKTRALINDLKTTDLNRLLIERNSELNSCEHERHHWRHAADQAQWGGQFAALQNQLMAMNSQLQETRQGINNFGTMAGVGMSSTSNNVR